MAKEWYKHYGYKVNPFHREPRFTDPFLGYDSLLEELFYRINSGTIIFIEGKEGKTALLAQIINKYKGHGKVAYVNCEKLQDEPEIKSILANGSVVKITDKHKMPKDMIVLFDNVKFLSPSNSEKIKYYFDQGNILSMVLTSDSYHNTKLPESLRHRIGRRVYKLKDISKTEAINIAISRIGNVDFFSKEAFEKIYDLTEPKTMKNFLTNCDRAMQKMYDEELKSVDDYIINSIFENDKDGMVQ